MATSKYVQKQYEKVLIHGVSKCLIAEQAHIASEKNIVRKLKEIRFLSEAYGCFEGVAGFVKTFQVQRHYAGLAATVFLAKNLENFVRHYK